MLKLTYSQLDQGLSALACSPLLVSGKYGKYVKLIWFLSKMKDSLGKSQKHLSGKYEVKSHFQTTIIGRMVNGAL